MKLEVRDIIALKGQRQLTELNVASVEHARAAGEAGIDMVVSGNLANRASYRAAAPDTHFTFGLKYGGPVNADEAKREAFDALEAGADSIYCPADFDIIEAMSREGIPVIGHVGLVPQKARWTGFRAVGKTAEEAFNVLQDIRRYEAAGAFAVEMEVVPHAIASRISAATPLSVISMGSGGGCDIQYLFAVDVLGETTGHVPRHARSYRDFQARFNELHQERRVAFEEFARDVTNGSFPAAGELVSVADEVIEQFEALSKE
jgi:3-methyl-2-oxobutanoate hydroxymethyltransferase